MFEGSGPDIGVAYSDCINLHIALFEEPGDIAARVAAVILFAVGDYDQCLSGMTALSCLFDPQVHGVVKGGGTLRIGGENPVQDLGTRGGVVLNQMRPVTEGDFEEFVVAVAGLEKALESGDGSLDNPGHRTGYVEYDSKRNGSIIIGKVSYLLLDSVVEDFKVVFAEAIYGPAV